MGDSRYNLGKIKSVCCQGTEGAYSHIAAIKIFPRTALSFVKTFGDVFDAVRAGVCDAGILPVENSTAGIVGGVVERLIKDDIAVIYAGTLDISHNLCAQKGSGLAQIKRIYSHQQALAQCSRYLGEIGIEQIETANTAVSAKLASQDGQSAAVCSLEAAQIFGLDVIKKDICNNKENQTRFIAVAKSADVPCDANVTSLFFKIKNKSGSLYETLAVFARHSVNMSSLHSIPLQEEIWNYGFYADIEGSIENKNIKDCLAEMRQSLLYLKVLGSYKSEKI